MKFSFMKFFFKVIVYVVFIYFQSSDQEALTKLFAGEDQSEAVRARFSLSQIWIFALRWYREYLHFEVIQGLLDDLIVYLGPHSHLES